jgi:hypothetical protein
MAEYYSKMKSYTDEVAAFGQPLDDDEFVAYVLKWLDEEFYNPLVPSIVARAESISPSELCSQMLSYELRIDKQNVGSYSSANSASRGRGAPWTPGGPPASHGHGSPSQHAHGGSSSGSNFRRNTGWTSDVVTGQNRPHCQVCYKVGHTAGVCWYRFDEEFVPDNRFAVVASSSFNGADLNWYLDSRATDHITDELEKLTMYERYNGADQIRVANGASMDIDHIGKSPTSSRPLYLNNVLHVPHAHKHLVYIHQFNVDNHTLIEVHSFFFLIKDQVTKKILLRGPCRDGLYLLHLMPSAHQKMFLSIIRPSPHRWHYRLGHPSIDIVHHILSSNNLPCSSDESHGSVCDACLHAKAHQLPYSKSNSVPTTPLELIYSDAWDPSLILLKIKGII